MSSSLLTAVGISLSTAFNTLAGSLK